MCIGLYKYCYWLYLTFYFQSITAGSVHFFTLQLSCRQLEDGRHPIHEAHPHISEFTKASLYYFHTGLQFQNIEEMLTFLIVANAQPSVICQ